MNDLKKIESGLITIALIAGILIMAWHWR